MKKLSNIKHKHRICPDQRIVITSSIVLIEYKDGRDLVIQRGDIRAESIVKKISLV